MVKYKEHPIHKFLMVSKCGNVYGKPREHIRISIYGHKHVVKRRKKFYKGFIGSHGYLEIGYNGKKYLIHRLVAETYFGLSDLQVNHIDGNKLNNNLKNLEYVTRKENIRHSYSIGLSKNINDNCNLTTYKKHEVYLIWFYLVYTNLKQKEIAKITNKKPQYISNLKNKRFRNHLGLINCDRKPYK